MTNEDCWQRVAVACGSDMQQETMWECQVQPLGHRQRAGDACQPT